LFIAKNNSRAAGIFGRYIDTISPSSTPKFLKNRAYFFISSKKSI